MKNSMRCNRWQIVALPLALGVSGCCGKIRSLAGKGEQSPETSPSAVPAATTAAAPTSPPKSKFEVVPGNPIAGGRPESLATLGRAPMKFTVPSSFKRALKNPASGAPVTKPKELAFFDGGGGLVLSVSAFYQSGRQDPVTELTSIAGTKWTYFARILPAGNGPGVFSIQQNDAGQPVSMRWSIWSVAHSSVRLLDLGRNRVGEAGVRAIVTSPYLSGLRALHLGRNALDRGAIGALGNGLGELERLDLDFNGLTGDDVRVLCASGRLAGLRELNLSNNRIGQAGCEALAACAELRSLEVLFLHDCRLDDDAVDALLGSPHLGALRNLAMSANSLTMKSVDALAACVPLASLGELDVCHNNADPVEAEIRLRASSVLGGVGRLCV